MFCHFGRYFFELQNDKIIYIGDLINPMYITKTCIIKGNLFEVNKSIPIQIKIFDSYHEMIHDYQYNYCLNAYINGNYDNYFCSDNCDCIECININEDEHEHTEN